MRILIIGGNRFFGRTLARMLADAGHAVTLLNRGSLDDGLGERVRRLVADRTDEAALGAAVAGEAFDLVYDQVCFDAAQAAAAARIFAGKTARYVFASTLSVYESGAALREEDFDPTRYAFEAEPSLPPDYGEAKRQAEARFAQDAPFPVASVRIPMVIGPDDYTGRLKVQVERIRDGQPLYFPSLDARLSCIRSDDAADTLFRLAEAPFAGPLNIGAREPLRLRDLVGWSEAATGRSAVLAKSEEEGLHSPYGIESDWFMDVSRAEGLGIRAADPAAWMPQLIASLAAG